ncbi:MAG: hypothetical protein JO270_27440 [Acidobacteriaceae bacterium]|nr:hypothetical protein [Acidobacteriaceae bacterium]MBV8571969.1 hypothetical protein [Acidobacteriaceae bacterium]
MGPSNREHAGQNLFAGWLLPHLRNELMKAVISLDIDRTASVIRHVSEHDAVSGRILSQYAEKDVYSSILPVLQPSEAMQT